MTRSTVLVAPLDAHPGPVVAQSGAKIGTSHLVRFYQQGGPWYPNARRLWLVQDQWPGHFPPEVLVALAPQESPFALPRPGNWPEQPSPAAGKRWGSWHLPIQLVVVPPSASWCNPLEKLWCKLKQEVLHLHRQANDLPRLRALVLDFLHQFATGSLELLKYVGLSIPR